MSKYNKVKIITLMDGTRVQIPEGSMTSSGGFKDRIYSSSKGDLLREEIVRGLSFRKGGRVRDKQPPKTKNISDLQSLEQG